MILIWPDTILNMNVKDIRRLNILALIKELGSQKVLGELTDTPASYISQVKNHTRTLGDAVAYRMEARLKKPAGWLDVAHQIQEPGTRYFVSRSFIPLLEIDQIESFLTPKSGSKRNSITKDIIHRDNLDCSLGERTFCIISQNDALRGVLPGSLMVVDPDVKPGPSQPSLWDLDGVLNFSVGHYVKNGVVEQLKYDNPGYQTVRLGGSAKRIGTVMMVVTDYR